MYRISKIKILRLYRFRSLCLYLAISNQMPSSTSRYISFSEKTNKYNNSKKAARESKAAREAGRGGGPV